MADSRTTGYRSEARVISIHGTVGAEFELYIKQGSNYYNWSTDAFVPTEKILNFQEIPEDGVFEKRYVIPTVTADTSYDFYIRALPGTTLKVPTTHEQKIGTLFQQGLKTATFTATESSALVIQNSGSAGSDLTGGTLTNNYTTLTQTGTITETSGLFVYIHSIPNWNSEDGGSWTLSNYVERTVINTDGLSALLEDAEGIATSYSVTGDNITDQITVSSISGDKVTFSASQDIEVGQTLVFSKSAWRIGPLSATVTDTSGTVTFSMTTTHNVEETGIADITCVLDADDHFSVKPNAFPINNLECPAGSEVTIYPIVDCTNYKGHYGDNDANVTSKTYYVHSVPAADSTAQRPVGYEIDGTVKYTTLSFAGTSSVSAGSAMGSAGVAEVTYTPSAEMQEGDIDYFYYKTVDGQSSPVTSATDQGKISITIV